MSLQSIHRIYTEKKNEKRIVDVIASEFESFTLQPVKGYYQGRAEQSIVVEIVGAKAPAIRALAGKIKRMNGQKSILIIHHRAETTAIRW